MSRSYQDLIEVKTDEMWEFLKETISIFIVGAFETTDVFAFSIDFTISAKNLKCIPSWLLES